jgi:hypothetical protein
MEKLAGGALAVFGHRPFIGFGKTQGIYGGENIN